MLTAIDIKRHALEVGFDLVGIAPPAAVRDLDFLRQWVKKGFGGEMGYLADPRREDPRRVLPSVKSVLCVALNYNAPYPYSMEVRASGRDGRPRAWISRYAWGRDYHPLMRGKLEQLRSTIERLAPEAETRVFVDTGPVDERAFARLSGIGWMGKNTCLINEQKGSWYFLGVILTSLELDLDLPAPDRCGSCTRCLEACPTGALVEPYVMDASRCIAYLNIELKGAIPDEVRAGMGGNLFGCDICQDVCPWNGPLTLVSAPFSKADAESGPASLARPKRAAATTLPEFQPMQVKIEARGAHLGNSEAQREPGRSADSPAAIPAPRAHAFSLFHPALEDLLSLTEEDYRRVFAHSPVKRAKYRGWLRNLCVVMGNSGDQRFIPWLEAAANDSDAVVREHAAWAIGRLRGDS